MIRTDCATSLPQVIREAKSLRQLQIAIPPVGKDLLVREVGLKRCHDLLKHVLREYEELVRKVAFSLLARLPSTVIPVFPARCR